MRSIPASTGESELHWSIALPTTAISTHWHTQIDHSTLCILCLTTTIYGTSRSIMQLQDVNGGTPKHKPSAGIKGAIARKATR